MSDPVARLNTVLEGRYATRSLATVSFFILIASCEAPSRQAGSSGSPAPSMNSSRTSRPEWVRGNPNQAVGTGYFEGEEQVRLERQLTPATEAWQRERSPWRREGLAAAAAFDVSEFSETDRVSVDVMRWQLETLIEREPFLGYEFPLQQFNGANVGLVNALTRGASRAVPEDAVTT